MVSTDGGRAVIGRASGPTQEHAFRRGPRIVALETLVPHDVMPGLVTLRVHTDAGTVDGQPVWRPLGGPVRDRVPVYNSCGGPFSGRSNRAAPSRSGWPGHGDPGQPGPLEDNWASVHRPADLAEELVAAGYRGMKLWSFDAVYRRQGGHLLAGEAADYAMIDPTWAGGISGSRRIADLAQVHNVSVLMHDCTGPLTLLAGVQIAAAHTAVAFQETVRAHLATLHPALIDEPLRVVDGHLPLPERSGLGARWLPELFDAGHPGYRVQRLS